MAVWVCVGQEETQTRLAEVSSAAKEKGLDVADLKWAYWMVISRSLGVLGTTGQRQLLIPFLGE